jgi:putative nucleotidyltransferase with HDIG domain
MRNIVFVDDEARVLDGIRRMLRSFRHEWSCTFFSNGSQALEFLASSHVDVLVSDMRMPGMDGAMLLRRVQQDFPYVIRVILSGQSENEAVLRSVGPAHQYLTKPCNADELRDVIARSCALRDILTGDNLQELVGRLECVPVVPDVLMEIRDALASDAVTTARIGEIISRDLGLTTKILQLVNSSFFGLRQQCDSVQQAVTYLGVNTIQSLVLASSVFAQMDDYVATQIDIKAIADHCIRTANLARKIATSAACPQHICDHAYLAASVHDIGKVILAVNNPDEFVGVVSASGGLARTHEREIDCFDVSHAHVGAYLLGLWGFPHPVIEAVCHHHGDHGGHAHAPSQTVTPMIALQVANALCHDDDELLPDPAIAPFLYDRLPEWRVLAEDPLAEVTK